MAEETASGTESANEGGSASSMAEISPAALEAPAGSPDAGEAGWEHPFKAHINKKHKRRIFAFFLICGLLILKSKQHFILCIKQLLYYSLVLFTKGRRLLTKRRG
jgi:hypothetical protein